MEFPKAFNLRTSTLWIACLLLAGYAFAQRIPAIPDSLFARLQPSHPRLILEASRMADLRAQEAAGGPIAEGMRNLRKRGEEILAASPVRHPGAGTSLLETSRLVLERVFILAFLAQMDGDARWARGAVRDLTAAAAFPDWNPGNFLDVAEMAAAFAIGYDWLQPWLTESEKAGMRQAIRDKAFRPALAEFEQKRFWIDSPINWNPVCNGGLVLAALAVGPEEPLARSLLHRALLSLDQSGALNAYAPDGAYPEGIWYWCYSIKYLTLLFAGLRTALGEDFGLTHRPGLAETGLFPIYAEGGNRRMFNFGDARDWRIFPHWMGGMAAAYGFPLYAWYAQANSGIHPLDLLWYDVRARTQDPRSLPRYRRFRVTELAIFRSEWLDTNASYLALKAGNPANEHAHLDAGTFVFDALGVRWAMDLGPDNYGLPGYFIDFGDSARRYTYYRVRALGHNTLTLNPGQGADQDLGTGSRIVAFDSLRSRAVADLTPAYGTRAATVLRGVSLLEGRSALIQDAVTLRSPGEIWWRMHTEASVSLAADRRSAYLERGGRRLWLQLLQPEGAVLVVQAAEPLPGTPRPAGQDPNIGVTVVGVRIQAASASLAVWLVPLRDGEPPPTRPPSLETLGATGWIPDVARPGRPPGLRPRLLRLGDGFMLDVSRPGGFTFRIAGLHGGILGEGGGRGPGRLRLDALRGQAGRWFVQVRQGADRFVLLPPP